LLAEKLKADKTQAVRKSRIFLFKTQFIGGFSYLNQKNLIVKRKGDFRLNVNGNQKFLKKS